MKAYSTDPRERVVAACGARPGPPDPTASPFSPRGAWIPQILPLAAGVRLEGVGACLAFDGGTDSAAFETYVGRCLAPTLRPGDVVIMDNLSCHKTAEVARLIAAAGACVRYLPAYSPDLNPIERMFSKLKAALRKAAARAVEALIDAMGEALRSVTPTDIRGWFAHTGYPPDGSSGRVKGKPL